MSRQTPSGQCSVSGSTVTMILDATSGAAVVNGYCVIDDQLTLHQPGFGSVTLTRN